MSGSRMLFSGTCEDWRLGNYGQGADKEEGGDRTFLKQGQPVTLKDSSDDSLWQLSRADIVLYDLRKEPSFNTVPLLIIKIT